MESLVKESFNGKSVLITGASGFVGKVLTEKLLRDCEGIKKVFLIFRSKKGQGLDRRFQKFHEHLLFERLKESGTFFDKVQPIYGDLLAGINAGISCEDLEVLRKDVNFVMHCAASIRFDETLKDAVTLNAIGTRSMLDLAESFSNLEAFVHVSTAYSNTNRDEIGEIIYEPILDYKKVTKACEKNDFEELQRMENSVLQTFPNTYIFSKNLTEKLISDRNLPFIIVRPSIITPAFNEPFPGWTDSGIYGPIGILLGASLGVLRTFYGNENIYSDLIPVDYCANSIIVAASHVAQHPKNHSKVINCTSQNSITWRDLIKKGKRAYKKDPSINAIWYPGGKMSNFYSVFLIRFIFLQFLPSCLIDIFLMIFRKKPRFVRIQMKMFNGIRLFEYFVMKQFTWRNDNLLELYDQLSADDK